MIINVREKNGEGLVQRVQRAIWKYKNFFQPHGKDRRIAINVFRNHGLPLTIEILPGKKSVVESCISLDEMALPPEIRAEIFPPCEGS